MIDVRYCQSPEIPLGFIKLQTEKKYATLQLCISVMSLLIGGVCFSSMHACSPSCLCRSSSFRGSLTDKLVRRLLFSSWSWAIWLSRSWASPLQTSSTSSSSWTHTLLSVSDCLRNEAPRQEVSHMHSVKHPVQYENICSIPLYLRYF